MHIYARFSLRSVFLGYYAAVSCVPRDGEAVIESLTLTNKMTETESGVSYKTRIPEQIE